MGKWFPLFTRVQCPIKKYRAHLVYEKMILIMLALRWFRFVLCFHFFQSFYNAPRDVDVLWFNGCNSRKCWQCQVLKSSTKLFNFHIVLIAIGKVWILLFSFLLCINIRTVWFFSLDYATALGEGSSEFKPVKLC